MFLDQLTDEGRTSVFLLLGGSLGLLAVVTLATRLLIHHVEPSPGRRALAHFLPIASAALAFCLLGRFEMALAVAFGTSVAALSAVTGFELLAGRGGQPPESSRICWMLLPAAVLLIFITSSRGYLNWKEASLFLAQGLVLLWLWLTAPPDPSAGQMAEHLDRIAPDPTPVHATFAPPPAQATAPADEPHSPVGRPAAPRIGLVATTVSALAIAVVTGLVAGAAAIGAEGFARINPPLTSPYTPMILGATLLSLTLALPMISTGIPLVVAGRPGQAITSQIGVVLLNLCGLVPGIVALWSAVNRYKSLRQWLGISAPLTDLPFPGALRRIDLAALVVLSIVLLGAATGMLKLSRRLGAALVLGYCAYLVAVLVPGAWRVAPLP